MKNKTTTAALLLLLLTLLTTTSTMAQKQDHASINGISMYYEIHGQGQPLVLIHGGGSTIETTFGRVIPMLAQHRQVIAVELQAHGRTSDRNTPETFEQDADDVAALLQHLHIDQADFLGFSNGATTTLQIAIRHPKLVHKMVLGSVLFQRDGMPDWFWGFMQKASLNEMPAPLREAYLKVNPNPKGLQTMHDKDAQRMVHFKDIPVEQIKAIKAPALIVHADKDVIFPEHALALQKLLTSSSLAIIPGVHGEYIGEITTLGTRSQQANYVIPMIEQFLDKK